MSVANITEIYPTSVLALMNSQFSFYITGSRYFKTNTLQSDWDFFVEKNEEVEEFLIDQGFFLDSQASYSDPSIYKVYINPNDNVQVQVIFDVELKRLAQMVIKRKNLITTDKEINRYIWGSNNLSAFLHTIGKNKGHFNRIRYYLIS